MLISVFVYHLKIQKKVVVARGLVFMSERKYNMKIGRANVKENNLDLS